MNFLLTFGFRRVASTSCLSAQFLRFGLALRGDLQGGGAILRGFLFGFGGDCDADRLALGLLARFNQLNRLLTLGDFRGARRRYLLFGARREGTGRIRLSLRFGLLFGLFRNRDSFVLLGHLDGLGTGNFALAQ